MSKLPAGARTANGRRAVLQMLDCMMSEQENIQTLRDGFMLHLVNNPVEFFTDILQPLIPREELFIPVESYENKLASDSAGLGVLEWGQRFLPKHFTLEPSDMHRGLSKELTRIKLERGARLVEIGPRGCAKSTVGSLADPLHDICYGLEKYIMIFSDTSEQAVMILGNIKEELETNVDLAEAYPEAVGKGPVWQENNIITRNGVTLQAFGTGKKIRGRRKGEARPTKVIVDDPENDDHITSPLKRGKTASWFDRAVMKVGSKITNVIVYGTSLQRDCLVENLSRRGGWSVQRWASICKWPSDMSLWAAWEVILQKHRIENSDVDPVVMAREFYDSHKEAMEEGAVVLWPERENLYELMSMRAIDGHNAFEAEKQSRPVNPELVEWPESYFDDSTWVSDWPRHLTLKTMALDPSKGKDAKRGDYSAIIKLGVLAGHIYVSANIKRRDVESIVFDLVEACQDFCPDDCKIEDNQFQELMCAPIIDECNRRGCHIPLSTYTNTVAKAVRIRRLTSWFAQKKVHFVDDSPGTRLLVDQLRDFPHADHDDGPDALEMALRAALELDDALQGQSG